MRLSKLRQTSQAAFAASSFSSWFLLEVFLALQVLVSHPCLHSCFCGTRTKLNKLSSEGRVEQAVEEGEGVVAGGGHGDHVCEDEEEV